MLFFYSDKPAHKRLIKWLAFVWTLVILILCFLPSDEVPDVHIPLIDKWVHFIMFGTFSFLWVSTFLRFKKYHLVLIFITAVLYGWFVEIVQGQLTFLGRSQDNMDVLADAVGGFIGLVVFYIGYTIRFKKDKTTYL